MFPVQRKETRKNAGLVDHQMDSWCDDRGREEKRKRATCVRTTARPTKQTIVKSAETNLPTGVLHVLLGTEVSLRRTSADENQRAGCVSTCTGQEDKHLGGRRTSPEKVDLREGDEPRALAFAVLSSQNEKSTAIDLNTPLKQQDQCRLSPGSYMIKDGGLWGGRPQ